MGPSIYSKLFSLSIPGHELRSSEIPNASVLTCRTKFGEHNVAYRGPVYWNELPIKIRMSESLEQFKRAVNTYDGFG